MILGFFAGYGRGCLYSFFIYGARLAVDIALLMLTRGKDEKVMNNMLREREMEQDGRFFILFFNIVILISRIDFLKAIFPI